MIIKNIKNVLFNDVVNELEAQAHEKEAEFERLKSENAALLEELALFTKIRVLELHEGDSLAVTAPFAISEDCAKRLREMIESRFPGRTCLVFDEGVELSVVRQTK